MSKKDALTDTARSFYDLLDEYLWVIAGSTGLLSIEVAMAVDALAEETWNDVLDMMTEDE